jgi:hypothetical protein
MVERMGIYCTERPQVFVEERAFGSGERRYVETDRRE